VRPTSPPVGTAPTPPTGDTVFTFTTAADSFTGGKGNDSFNGLVDTTTPANSTVTTADKIDGGAGTDTLSITVTGTGSTSLPGLTLSSVEKLSIRDQNTSGKLSTYDVQGIGITDVTSDVSTASGGLEFINLTTAATLTLLGDKATQVANVRFSMANASDTVSVVLDGGIQDTLVNGQTTITNVNGQASSATIVSNGALNTLGVITLAGGAGDTITTLTLNANADLTATLVATDYSSKAALTVTGVGKVNLGSTVGFDGSTIDASANSGGLTIGLSGSVQTYKGSSGADIVSGTTPVADNASIDGGAGVDTLSATLINSTNGAAFKNFEVLDLTGLSTTVTQDFAQLSNSAFTGVILNNTKTATTTLNNVIETADGFSLTVIKGSSGSHTTLNFDSASVTGTNDVLNLIYNGSGSTQLGAMTAQGVETIKIAAGGVTSFDGVNLTADSAKLISITGDQTFSLTVQAQGNITGSTVSQLSKIDASLATGSVDITVNAATASTGQSELTVLGGSGVNTFNVATSGIAGSKGITITTGLGNDTVSISRATLQNVTDATKLQFTTVTDLQTGDVLNFGTTINFQAAAVDVTGAADLRAALGIAIGSPAGKVTWFQFNSETYAVMNKFVGDGLTTDDIVVKLTGVPDLSAMQASGSTLTL
jgi:S-layer protein